MKANCISLMDYLPMINNEGPMKWQNLVTDSRAFSHPSHLSKGKGS